MKDLEQDDGRDGGALVHCGVEIPQGGRHVEALFPRTETDTPGELRRKQTKYNKVPA